MDPDKLKRYVEAALLAAGQPMTLAQMNGLFDEDEQPGHSLLRQALAALDAELEDRAVELVEVAGGYRLQIRQKLMPVISKMWTEKPPKYSRALLETLAIIAYRQPITRGEIEAIRGVSLSANILKTLQEREWTKTVGHRDVPGKPELLGTTREFLDYFNLKGLDDLPTLAEIRDLDNLEPELQLADPDRPASETPNDEQAKQTEPANDSENPPNEKREDRTEDDGDEERAVAEDTDGEETNEPIVGPEDLDESDREDEFEKDGLEEDDEDDGPEPQARDFDEDEDEDDESDDGSLEDFEDDEDSGRRTD